MKRKYILSIVAVIILAGMSYKLYSNKKQLNEKTHKTAARPTRVPVKTAIVQEQLLEMSIVKMGNISAFKEIKVLTQTSGTLHQVHFELGDQVKEGQILAVVDTRALQLDLQKAEANASKLRNELSIYTELLEGKAATQQKVNDLTKDYQDAVNEVNRVKKNITDASIKAPISGTIAVKSIEQGLFVNSGGEIATIVNLSKAKVQVSLTETEVYQVEEGQMVDIRTDVYPEKKFTGTVTFINPQADQTHSYTAEISMNNSDRAVLRSGTFVYVDLTKKTAEKVLAIPREALTESIKEARVFVVTDSVVHETKIESGREIGEHIQVLAGLQAGDIVVTSGQINLKEGSVVIVSN